MSGYEPPPRVFTYSCSSRSANTTITARIIVPEIPTTQYLQSFRYFSSASTGNQKNNRDTRFGITITAFFILPPPFSYLCLITNYSKDKF